MSCRLSCDCFSKGKSYLSLAVESVKLLLLNAYGYDEKFVPRFHHVLDGMIFPPFFHAVCNS